MTEMGKYLSGSEWSDNFIFLLLDDCFKETTVKYEIHLRFTQLSACS